MTQFRPLNGINEMYICQLIKLLSNHLTPHSNEGQSDYSKDQSIITQGPVP
jgi:hypothetical protein